MKEYEKIIKYITDKKYRFWIDTVHGRYDSLTDEEFLKKKFRITLGRELDLENPKTFNEKLQWLKIHNRNPLYTTMVDKYAVKDYVGKLIGYEHIIPTLGVWEHFDDIDFEALPDKFVLKCTHDSGGLYICRDKKKLDKRKLKGIKRSFEKILSRDYYFFSREWPYKNVPRRIIAEEYMEDMETQELRDYKFYTFDGIAKVMFIASERHSVGDEVKFDFFDMDFNHLPIINEHPNASKIPFKPKHFEEMKNLAEQLANNIPYVRVDFYEANDKVYFGEFTFSHMGGFGIFEPASWEEKMGQWIKLPVKTDGESSSFDNL